MRVIEDFRKEQGAARLRTLALFTAAAAALSVLERALPSPLPWLKPGLANIFSLVLVAGGAVREALLVAVLRTFLAALFFGGLFSIGHVFALCGALASVGAMRLAAAPGVFSLYGISMAGAFAHGLGQLALGRSVFLSSAATLAVATPLLLVSIATGVLTAWAAGRFFRTGAADA
jgi:heptaprenyl diphosphate synthase